MTKKSESDDAVGVRRFADHGLVFMLGDAIETGLSRRIAILADAVAADGLQGVADLVPSYTTLVVLLNPARADPAAITDAVRRHWTRIARAPMADASSWEVMIPVRYGGEDGPDLGDVARATGLDPDEVIRRHAGGTYQVGAIGFAPGFAFLVGLAPELAVPRRATPRTAVPRGSVGIGGRQTGIYSLATPGGWSLIGRTPLTMFDPDRDPPSLLQAGDAVRFEPAAAAPAVAPPLRRAGHGRPAPSHGDAVEVLAPGVQDTIQDLGRPGQGRLGVTPGGAADRAALMAGNRLLGNAEDAAGVEITLTGGRYRFLRPGRIALTGANLGARLNGLQVPPGARRVVGPGDELAFASGRERGMRAYLCLAGGIDVPVQLGSRSTDLTSGFGGIEGRPLRAGDRLCAGDDQGCTRSRRVSRAPNSSDVFRVVCGPQVERFDAEAYRTLFARVFTVSPQSNRLGLRLDGPPIVPVGGADIISEGLVTGAIQVTGGGQPIVMMPARATIGGYPKIATVIAADLDRLGQLRPGQRVRFMEVSLDGVDGLIPP